MYTPTEAFQFARTLKISAERQHATGVALAYYADDYESPAQALKALRAARKAALDKIAKTKDALRDAGFKDLQCHRSEYITAYGWQLNTKPWGNLDRFGNGRFVVATRDVNGEWQSDYLGWGD